MVAVGDEVNLNLSLVNDVNKSDVGGGVAKANTDNNNLQVSRINPEDEADSPSCGKIYDFYDKDRTIGILPQASMNFEFIGPDWAPILIDTVDKYIDIANTILDTGVSNYKQAHIPI